MQFAKTTDGISFDVYDVNSNALFLGDAEYCILNEQIIAVSEESIDSAGVLQTFLPRPRPMEKRGMCRPIILLDMT